MKLLEKFDYDEFVKKFKKVFFFDDDDDGGKSLRAHTLRVVAKGKCPKEH